MNKTNMLSPNLVNETSWSLNDSIIKHKVTNSYTKSPSINTLVVNSVVHMEETDRSERIHRSYGFILFAIPEYSSTTEGSWPEFEPTKQWLQKIHKQVNTYGVPNYKGARIRVPSTLNVKAWTQLVDNYDCKMLGE